MLSCKEVTHLLSEAQDRKITLPERVNLEMHLAICKGCKNFKSQMDGHFDPQSHHPQTTRDKKTIDKSIFCTSSTTRIRTRKPCLTN